MRDLYDLQNQIDDVEKVDIRDRAKLYQYYCRTRKSFTLDEVLYIINMINMRVDHDQIADYVKRAPHQISWFFLEYRPRKADGSYHKNKSVKTLEEVGEFDSKKQSTIKEKNISDGRSFKQYDSLKDLYQSFKVKYPGDGTEDFLKRVSRFKIKSRKWNG